MVGTERGPQGCDAQQPVLAAVPAMPGLVDGIALNIMSMGVCSQVYNVVDQVQSSLLAKGFEVLICSFLIFCPVMYLFYPTAWSPWAMAERWGRKQETRNSNSS
jgi:hypothetical protein